MKSKLVLFFFLLGSIGTIAAVAQEIHPDLEIRVQEYLGAGELNKKVYAEIKTNVAEDSKIICWSGLKRLVLMYQGEKLIYEFSSQAVCESVLNCTRLNNGNNG